MSILSRAFNTVDLHLEPKLRIVDINYNSLYDSNYTARIRVENVSKRFETLQFGPLRLRVIQ